jgi:hypothetical protein
VRLYEHSGASYTAAALIVGVAKRAKNCSDKFRQKRAGMVLQSVASIPD